MHLLYKITLKVAKLLTNTVMIIMFLVGGLAYTEAEMATKMVPEFLPKNQDQLEKIKVSISSLVINSAIQTLVPQEYPVQFEVFYGAAIEDPAKTSMGNSPRVIRSGNAYVYLFKDQAEQLKNNPSKAEPTMIAYGIAMEDGEVLSDPNKVIAFLKPKEPSIFSIYLMTIPLIYLALRISFSLLRKKLRPQATI